MELKNIKLDGKLRLSFDGELRLFILSENQEYKIRYRSN